MQSMWSHMWGGGSVYEQRDAHLYPLSGRSSSSEESPSHQRRGLFGGYHKRDRHRNAGAASLLHRSESDHEHDNDVPNSLLYEHEHDELPLPASARRPLQHEHQIDDRLQSTSPKAATDLWSLHAKERALWRWHNIANMDLFINDVLFNSYSFSPIKLYTYYIRKGLMCIILDEVIYLLIMVFITSFSIYLTRCINYSKIPHSTKLSEVKIPHCMAKCCKTLNVTNSSMPFGLTFILWIVIAFTIFHAMQKATHLTKWREIQQIYLHILQVREIDIQTISWQEIVKRLMEARQRYPMSPAASESLASNQRINPHDVANRIMRRDNYFIALVTGGVLKLSISLPLLGDKLFFTRHLEWYLNMVVMDYFCDRDGRISPYFLKESERDKLSQGRIRFFSIIAFICGPISFAYLILYSFFRYFHEYQKNPGVIGSRRYTPWAQWKFRQFNELDHYFQERIAMSYPIASEYVNQFPKEKTNRIAQFVAFLSGSFAAVLAVATLLDPELFLSFEITTNRTVLFYLGILGTIYGVARSMISDDMTYFDPEQQMKEVAECTYYMPEHWQGQLHTTEVQKEFSSLYQYEIFNLLQEIFSALLVPFILLKINSDDIVDFFRENSVNVDGLGLVCSHAVFDFSKPVKNSSLPVEPQDENARLEAKMQNSIMIFRENNNEWVSGDVNESMLNESGGVLHNPFRQKHPSHRTKSHRTRPIRNKQEHTFRKTFENNSGQHSSSNKRDDENESASFVPPSAWYSKAGKKTRNPPDVLQEEPEEEQRKSPLTDSFQSTGQPVAEEHRNIDDITAGGDPIHILGKLYQESGRVQGGPNR